MPAQFLNLPSPVLCAGADASLVLFDPLRVRECNDYADPMVPPFGIHKVWVHGRLAFDEGTFPPMADLPGRILQRTC